MATLTFEETKQPIAEIISRAGGDNEERKTLYIGEGEPTRNKPEELLHDDDMKEDRRMFTVAEAARLMDLLSCDDTPSKEDKELIHRVFPTLKEKMDNSIGREYVVPLDAKVFIHPSIKTERMMISGKSGSGKSTLMSKYMLLYLSMFPDKSITLISRTDGDPAFDGIPLNFILADDSLLEDPITIEELAGSLVVFDDVDNLQNEKLDKSVHKLVDDIFCNGRKLDIHVAYLSHMILNYRKTRNILAEADKVVMFNMGPSMQNRNFVAKHLGFDKHQVKKVMDLKSRWFCINTSYPNYVLSDHEIFLV